MLHKIDRLRLPASSRRDVESILVRQVTKELDHALPWQQGHGRRTAALAVSMGKRAGLSHEALHQLKLASLLHDIGLLTLPPHIFSERRPLEAETYIAIQCHPRVGAELLEPFHFLREARVFIAHHHERWDGSGYPYGIRGRFIPLEARILSIADAFDAIEVPEIEAPAIRTKVAYRILRVSAGTQFDRELIEVCGHCLEQPDHRPLIAPSVSRHDVVSDLFHEESP
ncbi:MAG: HD domain-containing phosphohydrolase [Nitrospirota bacterium]|nr:HD domain-containing phosphohydrolase [Nitrospirota bacterium]